VATLKNIRAAVFFYKFKNLNNSMTSSMYDSSNFTPNALRLGELFMKKLICIMLIMGIMAAATACSMAESLLSESPIVMQVPLLPIDDSTPESAPDTNVPSQYEIPLADFTYNHANFTINIAPATDDLLAVFEHIHEIDYYEVRGFLQGDRLVIWADVPLRDFGITNLSHDFVGDEIVYYHISTHGRIDSLLPGQAFVINNYVGMGTFPWSGFMFMDPTYELRYFAMMHNHSDLPHHVGIWPIIVMTIPFEPELTTESIHESPVETQPVEPLITNDTSSASDTPHPFADALSEFFVNLAPVPEWALPSPENTHTMPFITHAMLVDVDGNGTQGMLASKWTTDVQRYLPASSAESLLVHRLFLLDGNQVRPVALDNIAVTPAGRLITMSGVDGQGISMSAYTLLGFSNGQLAPVKSIMRTAYGHWERQLTGEGSDNFMMYYFVWVSSGEDDTYAINYHTSEFWNRDAGQDLPLTNAGFHEVMTRYGLHGTNPFIWELPDQTDRILSMTAN